MKRFLAAVSFLTIFPVPARYQAGEEEHGGSILYYPLVGLALGFLFCMLYTFMHGLMTPFATASVMVVVMSAVSGALHIDGLSDTFDAFMSQGSKERALEIMKDSSAGPMGVFAIISVLLIKFSAIVSINPSSVCTALLIAPLMGRCAMVIAIVAFPYVRSDGLGTALIKNAGMKHAVLGGLFSLAAGAYFGGGAGVFATAVMLAVTILFGIVSKRRIGGMTGDTYGALCEITEAIVLLGMAGYLAGR